MNDVIKGINSLSEKYGDEFSWGILTDGSSFVNELRKETDISLYTDIKAIARNYSGDDVLFLLDNTAYRIYHLTYSSDRQNGYPKFISFSDGAEAVSYIEKQYVEEYCR